MSARDVVPGWGPHCQRSRRSARQAMDYDYIGGNDRIGDAEILLVGCEAQVPVKYALQLQNVKHGAIEIELTWHPLG